MISVNPLDRPAPLLVWETKPCQLKLSPLVPGFPDLKTPVNARASDEPTTGGERDTWDVVVVSHRKLLGLASLKVEDGQTEGIRASDHSWRKASAAIDAPG